MSTSARPKSLAMMFLLGAFLTGGAVGFVADRAVTRSRPEKQYDEKAMRDEFANELSLTADQRRVIDSIFDWRRARSRELMQQYRPSLDSVRDSARVLMRSALDPAQQLKLTELIARNERSADSAARERGTRR
ncbi:MAG: hypothetical protein IT353_17100 [Gemmatimonadaceae bacterium]|nr:hypothetical protein [Gemmatimonadaceae bacterium]